LNKEEGAKKDERMVWFEMEKDGFEPGLNG